MPGVEPGGSVVVATTSGRVPSTPVAEPRRLTVVPTTPRLRLGTPTMWPNTAGVMTSSPEAVPSTSGAMQGTLAEEGTPSPLIEFASPPSDITEFVDAYHEGEELRFRRLDDIVGGTGPSGMAGRLLNDAELLLVSAEEPPTFALAKRDGNWRRAMLEEMKAIEENETWQLVDPPPGCRPISLKWVYKVKRDELGAIVKYKARLVARGFVQREGSTSRRSLHQ